MKIQYPWKKLKKGQGFFVPCLNTQKVYEEGLKEAISQKVLDAKAIIGIKQQRLGVLFFV
jgi:hypothetical protein|tara:strand:- start:3620 stop:3799 length:180 start_codon:yes stop_codon:yes gene_type:complete